MRYQSLAAAIFIAGISLSLNAQAADYSEEREPCANRSDTKNAFFGDLHVHTKRSFDAFQNGNRTLPKDAYAFGQGEPVDIPPYDEDGKGNTIEIDRPLDFMAVTDHSEFFGETYTCTTEDAEGYEAESCVRVRQTGTALQQDFSNALTDREPKRPEGVCESSDGGCKPIAKSVWQEMKDEAEKAYDRTSACTFTTFLGYEFTATTDASNLHRNVIFRNANVPDYAVSYIDAPKPELLWEALKETCTDGLEGCDVMAIPHNSNLSNGRMFAPIPGETEAASELAQLRIATEPIVEIIQHKANSECGNGLIGMIGAVDELCDFEQVRYVGGGHDIDPEIISTTLPGQQLPPVTDCADPETQNTPAFGMVNHGCVSTNDFARGALALGLEEEDRLGVNPFQFGLIGSTDTHLSNPGDVREATWNGHLGYETRLETRLGLGFMPSNRLGNPGGLAGVWAEENSRDSIFDAMKRKEVFATSGPRIRPRLFAAKEFDADMCSKVDRIERAYETGVPMGGTLDATQTAGKISFLAIALRDPADFAVPLQKIQIIKGWLGRGGQKKYEVFDVASAENENGATELCAVFEDPSFYTNQRAYYYLRAVEVPTKRWDTIQCNAAGDAAPDVCEEVGDNTIHEMAWTSPIWYAP